MPERDISSLGAMGHGDGGLWKILPPSPPSPPPSPPWPPLAPGSTYAITAEQLLAAADDGAVDRIVLASGTYDLPSTLSISRALTIEAEEAGTVVLDAKGRFGPVVAIKPGGTATLKGLDVTGGRLVSGLDVTGGGGLFIDEGATANLEGCNLHHNQAQVSARLPPLPGRYLHRPAGTLHAPSYGFAGMWLQRKRHLGVRGGCSHFEPSVTIPPAPR